ncbi:3-phosphoinositide-dependent protein kinase 1-like isoform X3 [Mucor ambiguus]|uniref:non-specific serine/threonine protein kinase n=1 Tax=Mucor ambiguus TaxID=91626 RepID=A0A0C9MPW3_9FUNG|nr:3-phosphoinositide-dependent protein kinase 1-like isoform X3 [Mucor ambiguus]
MAHAPPSPTQSTSNQSLTNNLNKGREPTLSTDVDDPSHPLYHHRRIVTDFDYGEILGEGSYSTVLIGRDKRTGKQYAIKRLDKAHIVKNNKVKYVMIERDALSRMNHPGIVKLYWTYKDNRSLYFVLDLAKNGELYTYIRRLAPFDLDTTKFYAAEILLSIEHIHSRGVIHRDIKPENILLDDNLHIKVTDFGSAKIINENENATTGDGENSSTAARSFVGTAEYVSPELLRSDAVSKEADLWAFGCVIFQMLSGKSPFKAATDYLIFQKIKSLDYVMPDGFSPEAKDIVQRLLTSDPEKRFGSAATGGISAIKEHPFFEGVDWENIFTSTAPPLRERLEIEVKAHPVVPPTFDFGGHDDEDDEDEDLWISQTSKSNRDRAAAVAARSSVASESALAGALAGAFAQSTPVEPTVQASASPIPDPYYDQTKSPPYTLTASTPAAQVSDTVAARKRAEHSQQSSSAGRLKLQAQQHMQKPSMSSNRSSHLSNELSSGSNSITPERTSGVGATTGAGAGRTQPHLPWIPHLYPNESVIKSGRVNRKGRFTSKKRNLILTNRPRLLYLDQGTDETKLDGDLRCEIPWTSHLLPELKGKSTFSIHTPEKSWTFEDRHHAQEWVNIINSMLVDSFGVAA